MGIFGGTSTPRTIKRTYIDSSEKQKRASDFKLAKDLIDQYDMQYNRDPESIAKIEENFDLHSGRWSKLENLDTSSNIQLGNENFVMDGGRLQHYPIIDMITKSIVGDIIQTPLIATVKDKSCKARNQKDRIVIEELKNLFNKKFIEPRVQELNKQYAQQLGIVDPSQLSQEEQQKIQQTVNEQVKKETPDEIMAIFDKSRTPEEIIAQIVLDDAIMAQDVKNKFDIGGENAVVTAEEYYRVGQRNNEPYLEVLKIKNVTWIGSQGTEFAEDGLMAKHTQILTPEDIISKYGYYLVKANIRSLKNYYTEVVGSDLGRGPVIYEEPGGRQFMDNFSADVADFVGSDPRLQNTNWLTREGQDVLQGLYSEVSNLSGYNLGIRETYITWKWIRKMKKITRVENGKKKVVIRDEHYTYNPLNGDIEEEDILAPQVWHAVKIGDEAENFYINIEPVPYQYNNIENPFDVKLTIYGGKYNTFQDNAKNTSFVDLGKPWNFKVNLKIKTMEESEKSDIGRILKTTISAKPDTWTWAEWYTSIRQSKILPISTQFEGANQLDLQGIQAIDLSYSNDIANHIKELEFYEKKVADAMYYNQAKLGNLGQYTTNQVAQQSSAGADRQMARFHNRHRMIKERVLTAFLNNALLAYRDNEYKKSVLFDDYSRAYLENIADPFPIGQLSLYLVDDFTEKTKVDQLRQLSLTMLQNGGQLLDIAEIFEADSIAQIKEILEKSDRKRSKEAELAHQRQLEEIQAQQAKEQAALDKQLQAQAQQKQIELQAKLQMSENQSNMLANANDINKDGQNDAYDRTLLEMHQKENQATRDHEIALRKQQADELEKQRQFEIDKKKLEQADRELDIKEKLAKKPKN